MKISEMVKKLEEIKSSLGDLEIVINYTNGRGYTNEVPATYLVASSQYKDSIKII